KTHAVPSLYAFTTKYSPDSFGKPSLLITLKSSVISILYCLPISNYFRLNKPFLTSAILALAATFSFDKPVFHRFKKRCIALDYIQHVPQVLVRKPNPRLVGDGFLTDCHQIER